MVVATTIACSKQLVVATEHAIINSEQQTIGGGNCNSMPSSTAESKQLRKLSVSKSNDKNELSAWTRTKYSSTGNTRNK